MLSVLVIYRAIGYTHPMHPEPVRRARRVALNVAAAALVLAIAKAVVGFLSGSVAIGSSALDSAGDALASFVNFVLLTIAAKPPDEDHPFGHGKAENLAAMFQGVLLLAGGVYFGAESLDRIRNPRPLGVSIVALVTMIVALAVTIAITGYLRRNAAESESAALAGDALHYASDIASNGATIIALLVVRFTGISLVDAVLGITVAAWIGWNSLHLIWQAAGDLMDPALPEEELEAIVGAIEKADPMIVEHRDLRTRRAAGVRFVEFELCIDRTVSFERAHDITELVKSRIRQAFPLSVVTVHAEPVERK